jgi:hypothetical protein
LKLLEERLQSLEAICICGRLIQLLMREMLNMVKHSRAGLEKKPC